MASSGLPQGISAEGQQCRPHSAGRCLPTPSFREVGEGPPWHPPHIHVREWESLPWTPADGAQAAPSPQPGPFPPPPRPPPPDEGPVSIWRCRLSSPSALHRCHHETWRNENKRCDKFVLFSFIINQNISACSKARLLINRQARGD